MSAVGALIDDTHIGVIGAGVGGLTLALALRHAGFPKVTVFEAAGSIETQPSWTLELSANASRVLHALGLEGVLRANAVMPGFAYTRAMRSGFVLLQRPLGEFSAARYGAPTYLIDANALCRLLVQACAERGVTLRLDDRVTDVDTQTGTVQPESGDGVTCSAVVAATGSGSHLSGIVCPEPTAQATDLRVVAARSRSPQELNAIITWTDQHRFCTQYPLEPERTDLLLVEKAGTSPISNPAEHLRSCLGGSHRQLADALRDLEWAAEFAVADAGPRDYWYAGRLALLGDACHRLPPTVPFGAAAAIEDAWVLSVMMERWEEAPHEGYPDYQRFRLARVKKLFRGAAEQVDELLTEPGRPTLLRNLRWSLTSRYLPEVSMARLDWLYGYDCIRGFA